MSFLDELQTDVELVDQESLLEDGPTYPTFQWRIGDPTNVAASQLRADDDGELAIAHAGGFFIAADRIDADEEEMIAAGFHEDSFITKPRAGGETGTEIEGWASQLLHIATIQKRRHLVVSDGDETRTFSSAEWDVAKEWGKPRTVRNFLVKVKGLERFGPFVLTLSGIAGMAFQGVGTHKSTGVLPLQRANILGPINAHLKAAKNPNRYGESSCYVPVGVEVADQTLKVGRKNVPVEDYPVFQVLGKGNNTTMAVVPTYLGPGKDEIDAEGFAEFYVGREELLDNQDIFKNEAVPWVEAWDRQSGEIAVDGKKDEAEEDDAEMARKVFEDTGDLGDNLGI